MMMNNAVENGTGRRAQLDGIKTAGKTGTTSAWRDAWFMGYTGNFVCGIWLGNDDYTPTRNMTGGTLPAMTWHKVMAYAHQGVEIKPLIGLKGTPAPRLEEPKVAVRPELHRSAAPDDAAATHFRATDAARENHARCRADIRRCRTTTGRPDARSRRPLPSPLQFVRGN